MAEEYRIRSNWVGDGLTIQWSAPYPTLRNDVHEVIVKIGDESQCRSGCRSRRAGLRVVKGDERPDGHHVDISLS